MEKGPADVEAEKIMESTSFEDGIIDLVCSAIERQGSGVVGRRGGTVFEAGRIKSLGCCEKEEGSGRAVSLSGQSICSKRRTRSAGFFCVRQVGKCTFLQPHHHHCLGDGLKHSPTPGHLMVSAVSRLDHLTLTLTLPSQTCLSLLKRTALAVWPRFCTLLLTDVRVKCRSSPSCLQPISPRHACASHPSSARTHNPCKGSFVLCELLSLVLPAASSRASHTQAAPSTRHHHDAHSKLHSSSHNIHRVSHGARHLQGPFAFGQVPLSSAAKGRAPGQAFAGAFPLSTRTS